MNVLFGLIFLAAVIVSLQIIGKVIWGLAAYAGQLLKQAGRIFRALQAKRRQAIPLLILPRATPDWEGLSTTTRHQLLARGPRSPSQALLLSTLDLEIAIELMKQELQRLRLETASLEPTTTTPAASADDNVAPPSDRFDESRDRPEAPVAGQRSVPPRAVQNDHFRH
jgi:hypothetical protein